MIADAAFTKTKQNALWWDLYNSKSDIMDWNMFNKLLHSSLKLGNKMLYHCSTQVQLGSMHSAPADVGDE